MRSCWYDRFRMAWRRSPHATMDAKLSELELISPRGGFRFTLSDGDDRKVLNRKLPRDKVLGFSAAPHMRAPPSIVFCRWRSEVSSLSRRASPANLTSGGITIPATVPHSGRESFEGTAPLFKTTLGATPKIGDVPSDHRTACRRIAARFRRWLDGGLHNCALRHHTINDKSP
jgi:hypothetical protein